MAAAAVVDAVGGTAGQACDAAAISFQNTMGTVCDLLHGMVEIPCHIRNAAAAAWRLCQRGPRSRRLHQLHPAGRDDRRGVCRGPCDAREWRCTSKGGLAVTPSAQMLKPRRDNSGCSS
ncbi:MAG: L-serine ammonia-lyase, iron-sulfur-dependent, subunit alpha [Pirellulales bacterium]